jgi:hypothetical protein
VLHNEMLGKYLRNSLQWRLKMKFNSMELQIITDALRRAAMRQESESKVTTLSRIAADAHMRKAAHMRALIDKINGITAVRSYVKRRMSAA